MKTVETDVLVVGAGVTGLTLSAYLARSGVPTVTIARHSGPAPSPRANVLNQRTVEVLRDLDLEDRVRAVATPLRDLGNGVLLTSFDGLEIARYSCYGTGAHQRSDYAIASPCEMLNAPQHLLEPLLFAGVREQGGEVRWRTQLERVEQTCDRVTAAVRDLGTGSEYEIRASYAVAADGARSRVADQQDFRFEGDAGLMHMLSIWIEADLTRFTAHRPAAIYWIVQPGNDYWVGSGTWICVKPFTEWLVHRQYEPTDGEPDGSEAGLLEIARTTIGDHNIDVALKDVSKWQVNRVVATEYRRGRVFLAGDAAHRHPPASGLGANTSIQDAFNLGWKLAMVVNARAGDGLLDSYHEERQPVGRQVVEHAHRTLENMSLVPQALGFRRGQAPADGRASLEDVFSDNPASISRRAALKEAVDLQNYRSNALGIQLGQRYDSGAVISDGTPFPEPDRDPLLYYQPTTHPGGYLPHAWVEQAAVRKSTLDLVGRDTFTLITGICGKAWEAGAKRVASELQVRLVIHRVGYRCPIDDVLGEWATRSELTEYGAILVRPDRHIAWRSCGAVEDPEGALRAALAECLDVSR